MAAALNFEAPLETPPEYKFATSAGDEKKSSKEFTGDGKAEYTNGDTYQGAYLEGMRHGPGTYAYYNKVKVGDDETAYYNFFQGTFKQNVKTGMGKVTYKDGGFYHGQFLNGKRSGQGTFKYSNGDIYCGMWKDGKKHGDGTYVYSKTKYEVTGNWKDGQVTKGVWKLSDGTQYEGGFKNQKPCGDGIWKMAKGTIVEGAYIQWVVPVDPPPGVSAPPPTKDGKPATETKILWQSADPATLVAVED
jgi:hypothetical protein